MRTTQEEVKTLLAWLPNCSEAKPGDYGEIPNLIDAAEDLLDYHNLIEAIGKIERRPMPNGNTYSERKRRDAQAVDDATDAEAFNECLDLINTIIKEEAGE